MTNPINKHLFRLTFVLILSGCASDPASDYNAYPQVTNNPQTSVPVRPSMSPPRPIQPHNPYHPKVPSYIPSDSYNHSYNEPYGTPGNYANSYPVRNFIRHMVGTHGFSETYLQGLFAQANRLDSVIRLENPAPSGSSKPRLGSWTRYRNKFLTDAHISDGVEFWRINADAIRQASSAYGVDPEYIVGIIGVETYFGKNIGKTCVFDALTTLSFDTYRRSKYFMSELENFLLMAREEGYNPREPVGSWAGAMGLGQFMPSSFRRLAVDFDRNGRRDLWHPNDAIGSVAHYFSRNGWDYKSPVAQPASDYYGASVIELSTYEGMEYWRVHPNFKVIKRYNNSNKYAMAVHQLAQAIKRRY
ncbi:lytic murein transglycosylase [Methyloglobulus sp.]|uniref:lytic murein transglycosylase n=1 Tax=Methyloglobulus sp. TaxID=2518622 RepID=UPI00398949EC